MLLFDRRSKGAVSRFVHFGETFAEPFNLNVIERLMFSSVCSDQVCFPCCADSFAIVVLRPKSYLFLNE